MKITDWVKPGDTSGEFKRQVSTFRNWVSPDPGAEFPAEKGRYHLYVSYACPWAHRTLITRKLKGLDDVISFSVVHWHLGQNGWRFVTADEKLPGQNVVPDPVDGHGAFKFLRDVYFDSEKEYSGRFTVPVLYDKVAQKIVNNESSEILRMLNSAFNGLVAKEFASVDVYPDALRDKIEAANEWTYDLINNGVYKSGFATTQEAYEKNVVALFEALDRTEKHLAEMKTTGPFYFGKTLTEADIRLYVTIVRFDPVYVQHFKCNIRDIRSGYPHIHNWMRHLYWSIPAFKDTTQFEHIKFHYTKSHTQINPFSITPVGPLPDILPLDEEVAPTMSHLIAPQIPVADDTIPGAVPVPKHGHGDLVQAVCFNSYGDRCATGAADGKIRVFNRNSGGVWKLCDSWNGHGGEVLELQWLPASIYPNLIASLGIDGHFKIWAEDPSSTSSAASAGRRFSASRASQKPVYETRSARAAYRSFAMRHDDDSRHTHLALLTADGELSLYEYDAPEQLTSGASAAAGSLLDKVRVCPKPLRGEEVAFSVAFDPNPLPCYTALRAGATTDSLALVVAAMDTVKVYRTRSPRPGSAAARALYLAGAVDGGHRGSLVRHVAWAPGNIRGYDVLASAGQDGRVRVYRLETPVARDDGKSWAMADVMRRAASGAPAHGTPGAAGQGGLAASLARAGSNLSAAVGSSAGAKDGSSSGGAGGGGAGGSGGGGGGGSGGDDAGMVMHDFYEMPSGVWAKSSEMKMERRQ
ncbi:hypothetical protein TD95_002400 [Thielaviopsis punctulata]|uniref:Glutathione S-transferase omega-like 2 n=1 Tax=Thielaviopsis punctulata TaxID=72032 RepID=A0A0F4ZBM9_9PEZI|nr:hypothetical protein TD95_002400 [Thielaviopsis punctulata]